MMNLESSLSQRSTANGTSPGMDGYELAEHIRDQQVHKPVVIIAVSGWGRKADVDRSLAVGSTTTWSSQYTTTFWSRCLHGARAIFQVSSER